MKKAISISKISGIAWKDIIKQQTGLDYASQSDATKKKWRKYFLYGMAAHTATDTFAHSCYYKDGKTGKMVAITHSNGADDPGVCPNRYKCAGLIAYYVAQECQENWLGDVQDFSAYGFSY